MGLVVQEKAEERVLMDFLRWKEGSLFTDVWEKSSVGHRPERDYDCGSVLQVSLESRETEKGIAGVKYLTCLAHDDPV